MKVLVLFLGFTMLSYAQDSTKLRRFSHEIQLNTYSVINSNMRILESQQLGGSEINYHFQYNPTKHFSFGVRAGYFYFSPNNDRYQMFPIYFTSNVYFDKERKVGISLDIGKPVLLYQDSKAIGAFYWGLTSQYESYTFRNRLGLIGQLSVKFQLYKGLKLYSGVNLYRTLRTEGLKESWLYSQGVRLGLAYQF